MRVVPAACAEQLTSQGLPLGPLAGPLKYIREPNGRLHTSISCAGIRDKLRTSVEPTAIPVAAAVRSKLCNQCCDVLPEPARRWELACLAVTNARKLTAALRVNPPARPHRWDDVVDVDVAAGNVRHLWQQLPDEQHDELAPHAQATLAELVAVRSLVVAAIPDDTDTLVAHVRGRGLLPGGADPMQPHVVAVTNATRSSRISGHGRYGAANLYSRANPILDDGTGLGFAVAPAAVVAALVDAAADTSRLRAHDLGPALGADTERLLRTATTVAVKMLDFGQRTGLTDIPTTLLTDALTVARGVHTSA